MYIFKTYSFPFLIGKSQSKRRYHNHGRDHHGHHKRTARVKQEKQVDENSVVIQLFRKCQSELDDRDDRHEHIEE